MIQFEKEYFSDGLKPPTSFKAFYSGGASHGRKVAIHKRVPQPDP